MRGVDRPGGPGQGGDPPDSAGLSARAPQADRSATLSEFVGDFSPEVAVILGTGMASVAERVRCRRTLPFSELPGLSDPSIVGHRGRVALGDWAGKRVLVFEGRLHYYEGHPWNAIEAPIDIVVTLGTRLLLLTNAAGGIDDALSPGSLMAVRDHIDWTRPACWRQPGPGGVGAARPSPYSPRLLQELLQAADRIGLALQTGVYAAVTGPCYETPAEIRALRAWGAHAVGMSTAREVEAGRDAGLECAAMSCITNRGAGLDAAPINHDEVVKTASAHSDRLADLLEEVLSRL